MIRLRARIKHSFIYKAARTIKNKVSCALHAFYENCLAGFLAQYLWFLYYPFYLYFKWRNICFVFNVSDGLGHLILELDYFFRMLQLNQIDVNKRYIFIKKSSDFSKACVRLYSHKFFYAEANTAKYYFFLPLLIRFKTITFDAGSCRMKWQTPRPKMRYNLNPKHPFIYQLPKSEGAKRFAEMFRVRAVSNTFFPLLDCVSDKTSLLLERMGLLCSKFCLVHIKERVCNATASTTDPKTYLKALEFLKKQGYQLVFAGREVMPCEFEQLGVINYAQSKLANFENDILLFKNAYLAITGGSGINMLADYFDVPVLYLNSWHLALQVFHRTSVCVPTLARKKNGEYLLFKEQVELAFAHETEVHEVFPHGHYEAINASSEDIYEGLQELLNVITNNIPRDPLYSQYVQTCNKYDLLTHCYSRVSSHFLRKYQRLFSV